MIIMNEEAKIGYPPARVWGCPTTGLHQLKVESCCYRGCVVSVFVFPLFMPSDLSLSVIEFVIVCVAMWTWRLGPEKAKRMLLTGDLITGREAERIGLVYKAVPLDQLD